MTGEIPAYCVYPKYLLNIAKDTDYKAGEIAPPAARIDEAHKL